MNQKPMTTAEFFRQICGELEKKGMLPTILDYHLADSDATPIRTPEFRIINNLDYGGSEGIYLDLAIKNTDGEDDTVHSLGTFKTLHSNPKAMQIMGKLLADFIVEAYTYVRAHLDDFLWTGASVFAFDPKTGQKLNWSYLCPNMESALVKKDELLKNYPRVLIRNNQTREETVYEEAPCLPQ